MKKLTKILAIALAFVFILSGTALATGPTLEDTTTVKINKELAVSPENSNPSETFNFKIGDGTGQRDGVELTTPQFANKDFQITIANGATSGSANITLPAYTQVGEYTYPLTETAGNKAGFDYDGNQYFLKVTVINNLEGSGFIRVLTLVGGDEKDVKKDAFKNKFDAGNLEVKKIVGGNFGDPNDEFTVTITLTPISGKILDKSIIDFGGANPTIINATTGELEVKYTVKHGDTISIKNIPYDVIYKVVETQDLTYEEAIYEGDYSANGFEVKKLTNKVTIKNNRNQEIQTGLDLTNTPFLILLGIASVGIVIVMVRRRKNITE